MLNLVCRPYYTDNKMIAFLWCGFTFKTSLAPERYAYILNLGYKEGALEVGYLR
jgi:hypothetical protein